MDSKRARLRLIRERHRKLVLESRLALGYALSKRSDDEVYFDDDELAARFTSTDEHSRLD
ncbi:MAG: hypothetical protein ACOC8E_03130 [Planctomycetota bacterium]